MLRGIGRRIATDERDHLRFQVDRLRQGFVGVSRPLRAAVGLVWTGVAAGAATVLVLDHGGALVACGLRRRRYWWDAVTTFHRAASAALAGGAPLGPSTAPGRHAGPRGAVAA